MSLMYSNILIDYSSKELVLRSPEPAAVKLAAFEEVLNKNNFKATHLLLSQADRQLLLGAYNKHLQIIQDNANKVREEDEDENYLAGAEEYIEEEEEDTSDEQDESEYSTNDDTIKESNKEETKLNPLKAHQAGKEKRRKVLDSPLNSTSSDEEDDSETPSSASGSSPLASPIPIRKSVHNSTASYLQYSAKKRLQLNVNRVAVPGPGANISIPPPAVTLNFSLCPNCNSATNSPKSELDSPEDISVDECISISSVPNKSGFEVLISILKMSEGRDKLFKVMQYGGNWIRWLIKTLTNTPLTAFIAKLFIGKFGANKNITRFLAILRMMCRVLDRLVGKFSLAMSNARQILRLFRWLYDLGDVSEAYNEWRESCKTGTKTDFNSLLALLGFINSVLGFLTDVLDDAEWIADQGLMPEKWSKLFGNLSAILWLITVFIDMPFTAAALIQLKQQKDQETPDSIEYNQTNQLYNSESLSLIRYIGDLGVSLSLVAAIRGVELSDGIAEGSGLLSGLISMYKLLKKQSLHHNKH